MLSAQREADSELVKMVIGFVSDSDKDIRSLAFDQIRTEAPGTEATKQFATLLSTLPADAQIGLLSALADRGDAAAKPAVLTALETKDDALAVAAINALGKLGDATDCPKLISLLLGGTDQAKAAARQGLIQLRGDECFESGGRRHPQGKGRRSNTAD